MLLSGTTLTARSDAYEDMRERVQALLEKAHDEDAVKWAHARAVLEVIDECRERVTR